MPEVIYGSDVVLEKLVDEVYYPVLCGTDCSLVRTPEIIEKTTAASGLWKDFAIRIEEFDVSVSGLTKIDNDDTLTFFYMLQSSVRRALGQYRMTFTDSDGNSKEITFAALIGQMSISGPASDFSQCSIAFKGSGEFIIQDVTPPDEGEFQILSDSWDTVNGQSYISGASTGDSTGTAYTLTADDVALEVTMEGVQYELVTGTPTAGQRECRFNTSNLRVEFPSDVVFDGSQRVMVLFKRPSP